MGHVGQMRRLRYVRQVEPALTRQRIAARQAVDQSGVKSDLAKTLTAGKVERMQRQNPIDDEVYCNSILQMIGL